MAVPKRKTSKGKSRSRQRAHKQKAMAVVLCSECGALHQPHRVCPSCGYYRGRQIITIEAK